ncbi:hypothetical protein BJ085DRAFT_34188 [Dimargaris cristalligena]|uniref:Uncharacterized protein n=1 Tax=Dimargaris cristalligena TaxID=215637 RepID=A0A4P9ZZ30_9FUNG|nr:hypothetical protein BJ085DRAFT_34188 [Dimargaris cristalligena]|eukprot:RKP39016.1 hypothetical protein BJ085DRAFT_34188 [Dimargaris cristalligena]
MLYSSFSVLTLAVTLVVFTASPGFTHPVQTTSIYGNDQPIPHPTPGDKTLPTVTTISTGTLPSPSGTSTATTKKVFVQYSVFESTYAATDSVGISLCSDASNSAIRVKSDFAKDLVTTGAGYTLAGTWLTIEQGPSTQYPHGCFAVTRGPLGESGAVLNPFVSAFGHDYAIGDTLLVAAIVGLALGNGQTHNGCLKIEGKGTEPGNLTIYIYSPKYQFLFTKFNGGPAKGVRKAQCTPGNYMTVAPSKNIATAPAH